jgi:hypothetical protein
MSGDAATLAAFVGKEKLDKRSEAEDSAGDSGVLQAAPPARYTAKGCGSILKY